MFKAQQLLGFFMRNDFLLMRFMVADFGATEANEPNGRGFFVSHSRKETEIIGAYEYTRNLDFGLCLINRQYGLMLRKWRH